jgi:hypothetical protein|tara:strand:+ start:56 stop:310 length:255 start_codon:yes stop_codon:yes gene_type:complete
MHNEKCEEHDCAHCCEECDCCGEQKTGVIDEALAKAVSRKLLVFTAATCLLLWSTLDPDTWAMIAAMYIGGQSVIDVAKVWKGM